MKQRLLFFSLLLLVAIVEGAILMFGEIHPPKTVQPKPKKKVIHLCACHLKPPPAPPKAAVEPKPKPKPKLKPKPKPRPKPKPKPKKREIKKRKCLKKRPVPKKVAVQKTPPPPPQPLFTPQPPPPVSAPPVITQKAPSRPVANRAEARRARARYLAKIREAIEAHKYYPRMAKKMRQVGTVKVRFTLLPDGALEDAAVVVPCRYKRLNKAALQTLERVGRFPPIPEKLGVSKLSICVPIRYSLR